ncbi:MAG: response regulator [Thermodesulfobacteriota bacterium]
MAKEKELTKAKILIVDDDPSVVSVLTTFLKGDGFTSVHGVQDSRVALAKYQSFKPDLVILDLLMPFVDGFTLLEQIKAIAPEQHNVLVLTSKNDRETRIKALESGAKEFLSKPFDKEEALARIKSLLRARLRLERLTRENQELEQMVKSLKSELAEIPSPHPSRKVKKP